VSPISNWKNEPECGRAGQINCRHDLALDKQRLGELIDLVGTIGLGDKENRSKDILGRVYEYFLGQFASSEPGQAANLQGASAFQIYEAKWLREKKTRWAAELEKKHADQFPPSEPAQGSA
jgi:hypothetical protein